MYKVLMFAKEKPGLKESLAELKKYTDDVMIFVGEVGTQIPPQSLITKPDITISYMSPWIIPPKVLQHTKKWAINFHPGPPEYPGIGCTNFAIYNGEHNYGVTAHLMEEKVDTGKIISVRRFPISPEETVFTLTSNSYENIKYQFATIIENIMVKNQLPFSDEIWAREPYTRRELNELCEINLQMSEKEINRRVKATSYPGKPGAFINIYENIFKYEASATL